MTTYVSELWRRLFQNIDEEYMEVFIVTSQASGALKSEGRQFGVGKSTLAIWIAYRAFAYAQGKVRIDWGRKTIVDESSEDEMVELMKHIIDNYVVWTLDDFLSLIASADARIPAVLWDDVQLDCPAWSHIPKEKREKIERLSVARQMVANIILTAPAISEIAKPLRKYISWEVIVPRRGVYEIQFISKSRNFRNPYTDKARLLYDTAGAFEPLPEEVMEYYISKRLQTTKNIIAPQTTQDMKSKIIELLQKGYDVSNIATITHMKKTKILEIINEVRGQGERQS